jgi:pimeloyl-ACP methyl ester carboxylesterase
LRPDRGLCSLDAGSRPRRSAIRSAYAAKPGTRFVRIDNSGHMIMYEQPRAFNAALRDFLAR